MPSQYWDFGAWFVVPACFELCFAFVSGAFALSSSRSKPSQAKPLAQHYRPVPYFSSAKPMQCYHGNLMAYASRHPDHPMISLSYDSCYSYIDSGCRAGHSGPIRSTPIPIHLPCPTLQLGYTYDPSCLSLIVHLNDLDIHLVLPLLDLPIMVSNYVGVSRGAQITGVAVCSLTLIWLSFALRLYVRGRILKFLGREDWITVAAMVGTSIDTKK